VLRKREVGEKAAFLSSWPTPDEFRETMAIRTKKSAGTRSKKMRQGKPLR